MSENIDKRDLNELHRAFLYADYLVKKKYRGYLDAYPLCAVPQWMEQSIQWRKQEEAEEDTAEQGSGEGQHFDIGDNVQFFRIDRLVYDRQEDVLDKLTTVYHSLASYPDAAIVQVIQVEKGKAELYLGIAQRYAQNDTDIVTPRGKKLATLQKAFMSNFPGSKTEFPLKRTSSKDLILRMYNNAKAVSCVSGIPDLRDRDKHGQGGFVQGLEKLIDAMREETFTVLMIADCENAAAIENLCAGYEDLYSQLSPFAQSQQTVGTTESQANTESFIKGVVDTTNTSTAKMTGSSETTGHTNTVGGGATAGGKVGLPLVAEGRASISIHYSHSWQNSKGKNQSITDTTGASKSLTEQNSVSKAITTGSTNGLQITVQNRAVKTLMDRIDEQIKYLRSCEAYGVYNFCCYFLSNDSKVTRSAASIYNAVIRGDRSSSEAFAIGTWTDEAASEAVKYLTRFYHPRIAIPDFRQEEDDKHQYPISEVEPGTLINGRELAISMGLPRKSLRGLPVVECAPFGRNTPDNQDGIALGKIYHMRKAETAKVDLDRNMLTAHTFITGSTGSGKTNTVCHLLDKLCLEEKENKTHFLVIEPAKGEYKDVFGGQKDIVKVYGTNPNKTPLLRIDPFSFPERIHIYEHMDRLVEIFNVCWPMYAAMPAVLKDAIERAYAAAGWDLRKSTNPYGRLFPAFTDVLEQIDKVMEASQYSADSKGDYKGALSTRLRSLTNGINGMLFCSDELSEEELFDQNVIVDLSRVGSVETKALIMGLLVMKLQEHRMCEVAKNSTLRHVTVLEEAHNLLKRTSTEQTTEGANLIGKSVEMLTNAIAEMRTYGEGFIIADQAPGLLDMAVIRNTNTKIILRLPEFSDRELVGKACGLRDDQIEELARLEQGVAAVYQNGWIEAVLCKVDEHKERSPLNDCPDSKDNTDILKRRIFTAPLRGEAPDRFCDLEGLSGDDILQTDLPTSVKLGLLEFPKDKSDREKLEAAIRLVYDLSHAETALQKAERIKDNSDWLNYLNSILDPEFRKYLPEESVNVMIKLMLPVYMERHAECERTLCLRLQEGGLL